MMHQVYKTLPDDRPIMAINIVEDPDKCPSGFVVVSRTHDQDSDADLWREGGFFGKKITRYICLSKTEGIPDYIVESIAIINEKEVPPDGYSVLTRTADTDQKAWRKRQLCYRLARQNHATSAVTDIIVLSRMKKAPNGFSLAGEINGMTVCFKSGVCTPPHKSNAVSQPMQLLYSLSPAPTYLPHSQNPHRFVPATVVPKPPANGVPHSGSESPHEYEQLVSLRPSRPAPKPPNNSPGTYATIAAYSGLDGVPFILNPSFQNLANGTSHQIPVIKAKTKYQIDKEGGTRHTPLRGNAIRQCCRTPSGCSPSSAQGQTSSHLKHIIGGHCQTMRKRDDEECIVILDTGSPEVLDQLTNILGCFSNQA